MLGEKDEDRHREREGENQGKLAKNTSTGKIVHAKMLRINTQAEFVALLCTRSSPPEHLTQSGFWQDLKGLQFKLFCTVKMYHAITTYRDGQFALSRACHNQIRPTPWL